jgi:LuxR family maltose regulon positive regulatory protein
MIDRKEEASKELKLALDMAVPDMIIMPFAESEYYILDLLKEFQASGIYEKEIEEIVVLSEKFNSSRQKICQEHFGEYGDYGLSERELGIAILAAKRKTNSEIAEKLHLAEGTVRNQLSRIFDKLGIEEQGKNKRLALEKLLKIKK